MSILGVIVRTRPDDVQAIEERLRALPGVEVAAREDRADPRLVAVIEDGAGCSAAATLDDIVRWPLVLGTSLVYEYSGPDSPAPEAVHGYRDWRGALAAK